jgi:hypothetical protein
MAAGMWQGILAGYQNVEEKRMAREAKEEELREKRKGLALQLAARYGTRGFGGGTTPEGLAGGSVGGTSVGAGGNLEHFSQVLKTQFGVSDEAISRVAGTAGAAGLNQAFDILENTRKRFADLGRPMPEDIVTNLFDSAVLTGAPEDDLDFGALEEYIGGAIDPLEKEIVRASRASTGQAYFPEPSVIEAPRVEDLDRIEQRAINASAQMATTEVRNLNNALNNIQRTEATETDPNALAELAQTKDWIIDRQARVQDALKSAEGEGGNPFGLVNLYGNEFLQQMFEADPRLSGGVLSPVFQEARTASPKRVDSLPQLRNLARLGVIGVGDKIEILDPVTGEYVLQTIGE